MVTSFPVAYKYLPAFTASWMFWLMAFCFELVLTGAFITVFSLVDFYLFQSSPALGPSQKLSQSYCQRRVAWKHVGDVIWILQSESKYYDQETLDPSDRKIPR